MIAYFVEYNIGLLVDESKSVIRILHLVNIS